MPVTTTDTITIRRAGSADFDALEDLARLDASRIPEGQLLLAESDGELRAALSIVSRRYIADPFYPSRELVALLDQHAARLRADSLPLTARVRARLEQWSELWWRAALLGRVL